MDFWDERYGTEEYVYGTAPNDFLAAECHRIPPGPVLCLADGEGRNGVHLAALGFVVTSVDASSVGLAKARRLADSRNVVLHAQLADLSTFDPGRDVWSGIVSIFAHLPPDLRRAVHARVRDALAPGGCFLLEAYTPTHREMGRRGGPAQLDWLMTLAAVTSELAPLDIELGREIERDVNEGHQHAGPSHVVQVVARKPAG